MPEKINVKALIFDFDNTLVDTHTAINGAYSEIIKRLSERFNLEGGKLKEEILKAQREAIDDVPLEKREYDRKKVIEKLNENLAFGLDEKEVNELAELFYEFILEKITYPEYTEEILETLKKKGKKLGLLTDSDVRSGLKRQRLNRLGFTRLFDAVIIAGETIPQKKNSPIPFIELSRLLGVKPAETVVVGDRADSDIDNAKEAGMKAILINKYLEPNQGRYEPDYTIHDIKELLYIIE